MELLHTLLIEHSAVQAFIVISLVSALGLVFGRINLFGISLGITFVFFWGIIAGHFGLGIDPQMLSFAENFGLIIFVYALGLQVGPGFFSSFGRAGLKLNMLAVSVVVIGAAMTLGLHVATGVSLPDMVGIFCGAVTNTPALGAAQQAIGQAAITDVSLAQADLALGCAVAYPLGVVGVILALIFIRKFIPAAVSHQVTDDNEETNKTFTAGFKISNPEIFGKSIQEVAGYYHYKFLITSIFRDEKLVTPHSDTVLKEGDKLLVITSKKDVQPLTEVFGACESVVDWDKNGIDRNALDTHFQSHRIVITRPEINGKKLGTLKLRNLYGVNVTRVYRAGIQLLPTSELILQFGDRLTVVGEETAVANVAKLLGNTMKSLKEPNLATVYAGIILGLVLGSLPIVFPGMSFPVKLGIAGGPIIVGILMGAFGPRLHMITYTTASANLMLRGLGLSIFLACLGLRAGVHFFDAVFRPEGLLWVALGFLLTVVPLLLVALIALKFMRFNYSSVAGMLCGSMTNPMALNYINSTIESDMPAVAYATVYPLTMFLRVIVVQLIIMFFV